VVAPVREVIVEDGLNGVGGFCEPRVEGDLALPFFAELLVADVDPLVSKGRKELLTLLTKGSSTTSE